MSRITIQRQHPRHAPLILWCVVCLTLVGVALRLHYIHMPMRGDEAGTFLFFAMKPLSEGLSTYWGFNNHLLNTLLMHGSYLLWGMDELWLRLPALFAGVLIIPATYAVGRAYYSPRTGLLAAALVTSASALVGYSVNARGYTLLILFFLLMLVAVRQLQDRQRTADWALFIVFSALGFYAVPTMLWAFPIGVVWLGLSYLIEYRGAPRWARLRNLVLSCIGVGLLTGILYLPALIYVARLTPSTITDFGNAVPLSLRDYPASFAESAHTIWLQSWMRDLPTAVHAVLAGLIIAGILFHRRIATYTVPLALAVVVGLLPFLILMRPVLLVRTWLFLLPIYMITGAAGLDATLSFLRPQRNLGVIVSIGALGLALWFGLLDVRKASIYADTETGNFMSRPLTVLDYLNATLNHGDFVIAQKSITTIINYYALKENRPFDDSHFLTPSGPFATRVWPEDARKLFIVTDRNLSPDKVEQNILLDLPLNRSRYGPLKLIQTFDQNQIYELSLLDS